MVHGSWVAFKLCRAVCPYPCWSMLAAGFSGSTGTGMGDGVRPKEANDASLKAVSCVSVARLRLKFEFRADSLADALKAASPQSKSGISLVQAIWF